MFKKIYNRKILINMHHKGKSKDSKHYMKRDKLCSNWSSLFPFYKDYKREKESPPIINRNSIAVQGQCTWSRLQKQAL